MDVLTGETQLVDSIGIKPIQIRFTTNINSSNSSILTKDMIYIPESDDEEESNEDPNEELKEEQNEESKEDSSTSQYPYFTDTVRFPTSKILNLSREDQMRLFFDKKKFKKVIGNLSNISEDARIANAEHNFTTLLNILLPTSFPIKNNIYETFSGNIKNVPNISNFEEDFDFFSLFSQIFTDEKNKYGYVSINGKNYTVIKITFINDIINDPVFMNLLNGGKNFQSWRKSKINDIKKNVDFLQIKLTNIIKKDLTNIQKELSSKGTQANTVLDKIQNESLPSNRLANVPVSLLAPLLKNLINEKLVNTENIINIFIKIYKLKEKSGERSQIYIPIQIESLIGFKELLKTSVDYYVKRKILEAMNDANEMNKFINIRKEEDVNELNGVDKRIYKEISQYDKVTAFLKEIQNYMAPTRIYTNPNLMNILGESKNNIEDFIKFIEFINAIRIEGEKPKDNILNNYDMIDKLKTGIMCVTKKQQGGDENNDVLNINNENYYDAFINLELVNGTIDNDNIEEVKCPYRDRLLMNMYNNIKYADQKNPVLFYIDEQPFDMSKIKTSKKQRKTPKKGAKNKGGHGTTGIRKGGFKGLSLRSISLQSIPNNRTKKRRKKNSNKTNSDTI